MELLGKKYKVLDYGWIELQEIMGSDRSIVSAARTSYMGESKGDKADKDLLFSLMERGHTTPFEMAELRFRVRCPVLVFWQWVRHRTWSFNVSSGRYTEFTDEFYLPEKWRTQHKTDKQMSGGNLTGMTPFDLSLDLLNHYEQSYMKYQSALAAGVAREQARLFLPAWGSYYTFVGKIDAHNLMKFLSLRLEEHAQWEIRQYADMVYSIFQQVLPWTAEAFEQYRLNPNCSR